MNNKYKLSIVIPIHNLEKYIVKCLTSIFCQTFQDIEVLCILDACIDNTEILIKKFPVKIHKCYFKRAGLTRNVGIENAQGEYIWFIDGDDWLTHNKVFEQVLPYLDGKNNVLSFNIKMNSTTVWSHIFKREYLINSKVKFNNNIIREDSDFLNELKNLEGYSEIVIPDSSDFYHYNYPRVGSVRYKNQMMYRLFFAYSGCGKTTFSKNNAGYIDVDRYAFMNNNYHVMLGYIIHLLKNGFTVLASADINIIRLAYNAGLPINLILPDKDMKEEILKRVENRGDPACTNFVTNIYDREYEALDNLKCCDEKFYLSHGEYINKILDKYVIWQKNTMEHDIKCVMLK